MILLGLGMAACGGRAPLATNAGLTVTAASELPAPTRADVSPDTRPGAIGPFDKLSIQVVGLSELNLEDIQVGPDGQITVPIAGTIDAAGQTPAELSATLRARLRAAYVRDPQVSVNLREMVSHTFAVDGQVAEPGLYPAIGDMTLSRAVATAKGATEFAKLDDVVVFRTVGNQRMAALYNLSAIRRGTYPDPKIYAKDTIVVGDSPARRLFRDVASLSPIIAGPIIALLQSN